MDREGISTLSSRSGMSTLPATEPVVRVTSSAEIGKLVRAARLANGLDQVTAAGLAGVGVRFLGDLERGRPNLRIALVLQVLERLGISVWLAPRAWKPTAGR